MMRSGHPRTARTAPLRRMYVAWGTPSCCSTQSWISRRDRVLRACYIRQGPHRLRWCVRSRTMGCLMRHFITFIIYFTNLTTFYHAPAVAHLATFSETFPFFLSSSPLGSVACMISFVVFFSPHFPLFAHIVRSLRVSSAFDAAGYKNPGPALSRCRQLP